MQRILIVSATPFEIAASIKYLEDNFSLKEGSFVRGPLSVDILITGVGMVNTSFHLTRHLPGHPPYNLAINAGIAGCFDRSVPLATVANVVRDTFGDIGVTESDGSFLDVFDLRFADRAETPFEDGWLVNDPEGAAFLPNMSSVTVNTVTGTVNGIERLQGKYNPQLESMEGAAFAYVCSMMEQKYLQIRSVSNYIEPRNRSNWKVEEALDSLNEVMISILNAIGE